MQPKMSGGMWRGVLYRLYLTGPTSREPAGQGALRRATQSREARLRVVRALRCERITPSLHGRLPWRYIATSLGDVLCCFGGTIYG